MKVALLVASAERNSRSPGSSRLPDIKKVFPDFQPCPSPLRWLDTVNNTNGQTLYQERSPVSGAITIEQQEQYRVLRVGGWVNSIVLTEAEGSSNSLTTATTVKNDQLILAYMRVMVAAAFSFLATPLPHSSGGTLDPRQAHYLCLGLGGGALPMFLQHYLGQDDGMQLSAVELDPVVPKAAKQCMGLNQQFGTHKGSTLFIGDAADYVAALASASRIAPMTALRRASAQPHPPEQLQDQLHPCDCIMLDCFDSNAEVPSQFMAPKFISDCRQIVPDGGLLVANMINGAPGCSWRKDFGKIAWQMAAEFGPTFSIGIRDDNQQNVILVAKKVPKAYQAEVADDLSNEDLAVYKHKLQETADYLGRSCSMPYDLASMLHELYRIVPNRAYNNVVYELEINHAQDYA
ncbi:hypothetical protein WJX74_006082 [Apatococcus lobatus]|uniref:Uncharacterized protein n=1 Tax=Apatococcus lobatus TaxID=904363 RepID=A0AAW1RLZ9_9CHLO